MKRGKRGHPAFSKPAVFVIAAARCAAIGSLVAVGIAADPAFASGLTIRPELTQRVEYNDNKRLAVRDGLATAGSLTDIGATFSREAPSWSTALGTRARFNRFSTEEDIDSDEIFLDLNSSWRNEQLTLNGGFSARRESTLTSEIVDANLRSTNQYFYTLAVNATGRYTFASRHAVSLSVAASDVTFQDRGTFDYIDYSYYSITPQYDLQWTDKIGIYLSGYFSEFDAANETHTRSLGAMAGVNYRFSDVMEGSIGAGYNVSDTRFLRPTTFGDLGVTGPLALLPVIEPDGSVRLMRDAADDSGLLAAASLRQTFEKSDLTVTARRQVSASNWGEQITTNSIDVAYRYSLARDLSLRATGYLYDRTAAGNVRQDLDLSYARLGMSMQYRLSRAIYIEGGYDLRLQKWQASHDTAIGHGVSVQLRYLPESRPIGRWLD